jgi:hypothetical protein
MPTVSVHNVGREGIIKDIPPHLLAPEAWSDGQNVRFRDNKVVKFLGHADIFGAPTVAPYWALGCPTDTSFLWLYAGINEVYTVDGTVHTKITRSASSYAASAVRLWNGGIFNGIPVINNGEDVPQSWNTIAAGTPLVDLVNWPSGYQCRVIKPFGNFLVALNITKSDTGQPHLVLWSHSADPATLPTSWSVTTATVDAGENELSDVEAGIIRSGLGLRDLFIIYKANSTWGMQFVGGKFIMRFFPILTTSGILSDHCVSALPDGVRHFVMTGDDIIVHDGQSAQSVLDERWKRFYNNNMSNLNYQASFTTLNYKDGEAWACFPSSSSTWPDLALIWNWKTNVIGVRQLSNIAFIAAGVVDESIAGSWDADATSWDADLSEWDGELFGPGALGQLAMNPEDTKLYNLDSTNQFSGTSMTSYVQREGLAIVGRDREGNPKVDMDSIKLCSRIWPKTNGSVVAVRVGSQEVPGGTITWDTSQNFDPSTDNYLDVGPVTGRLLAVDFRSTGDVAWELEGYDLDVDVLGRF